MKIKNQMYGISYIEIVIIIAILGLLASVALPALSERRLRLVRAKMDELSRTNDVIPIESLPNFFYFPNYTPTELARFAPATKKLRLVVLVPAPVTHSGELGNIGTYCQKLARTNGCFALFERLSPSPNER